MARIFSWYIKDEEKQLECFSYLAQSGSQGTYVTGSMVIDNKIESSETLKKIADVVSGYTESEYQTQFNNMKTKVAAKGLNPIWKDYTYYYDVNGNNLIMLTGNGEIGPQGPQGIQGEKGETGSAGKGRNIMCYCGLDSGITPTRANVTGGKFYPNKWEIEFPTDPSGVCVWQDSNEFGSGKVVWMTNADFPSSTGDSPSEAVTPVVKTDSHGQQYTWATPIQISGPKGDNGADGERIEFVYKRCHKRTDPVPDRPTGTTEEQAEAQGWTDHPLGIVGDSDNPNENWRVEYMCQHIKDEEGNWGEFTDPILWASWGEDGNDGDGIEYIFAVTSAYNNDYITTKLPKSTDAALRDYWQDPEIWDYIREHGLETRYAPWTDDPQDVSAEEPYEWVSIRRRKWNAAQDEGVFGEFGEPKLWAHWGKDGEKGNDGTSVDIRDQSDTLGHLLKKLGNNVPEVGFSYAIGADGKRVYVWMEQDSSYQTGRSRYIPPMSPEWYEKTDDDVYNNWYYLKDDKKYWFTDCGSFYGEPGDNAYVHMKYGRDYKESYGPIDHRTVVIDGKSVEICFTVNDGETPGKYIATYTDNIFDDRGDLDYYDNKWSKWEGDDGQSFGQEQIFFRSKTKINIGTYTKIATENAHGYEVGEKYLKVTYPDVCFTTPDWVPNNNWSDVPLGIVPGEWNFEYVAVRRLVQDGSEYDGTWSYFSIPALYNEAVDTPTFQVEYTKWTGTTKPVLTDANNYTRNGIFDEVAWRNDNASTGPWTDDNDDDTTWMAQCNGYFENSDETKLKWNDWIVFRCKGHDGARGNGRNVMAYCSLPQGYTPTQANITGGKFYPNKWDISYPTDPVGITGDKGRLFCSWGDSNEPADPSYMVWMINADFPNSTGSSEDEAVDPIVKTNSTGGTYTWSTPLCITGEKGDNGADGDAIEFIYFRTTDNTIIPDRPGGMSDPDYQKPDFTPEAYINGIDTGEKWKDHPLGITEDFKSEWMSQRTKDSTTGLWGAFTQVAPWSRWGEDGIDGDGIEYIFAITSEMTDQAKNSIIAKLPRSTDAALSGQWQNPEIWDYIREHGLESRYAPWTDDPSDVGPTEPYEWVCMRKRKWNATLEDSQFGEFGDPVLWGRWNETVFTSFAFAELLSGPDYNISDCTVTGGSFGNPIPTTTKRGTEVLDYVHWTDGPTSTSAGTQIWMTKATFSNSGATGMILGDGWSKPELMADTDNFEVMYSPRDTDTLDTLPPNFKKTGVDIDARWLASAVQKGWYDEVSDIPAGQQAIYMATITGHNNVWDKDGDGHDDWQYMRVKGEKGDPGSSPTDLEYLNEVFDNVEQGPGAFLREFLGVTDTPQGTHIVAFLNGSANIAQKDGNTLMIAAGCNGLTDANNAKFRVYSNGDVYAENGYFKGEIEASTGNIGGITISDNNISANQDDNGFIFGADGTFTINNEDIKISNNGIEFLSSGNSVLSVTKKNYDGLNDYLDELTGDTINIPITSFDVVNTAMTFDTSNPNWYVVGDDSSYGNPITITGFTISSKQKVTLNIGSFTMDGSVLGASYSNTQLFAHFTLAFIKTNGWAKYDLVTDDITKRDRTHYDIYQNRSFSAILDAGDYELVIMPLSEPYWAEFGALTQYAASEPVGTLIFTVRLTNSSITSAPINGGVEIFGNGVGIRFASTDYFFVAVPFNNSRLQNLVLSVKSNGKGFTLDENGWTNHGITP